MGERHSNAYWELWAEVARGRLYLRRSALAYPTLDELKLRCEEVCAWLAPYDRARHCLRVDLREGPGRNDEAFERAMAIYRVRFQQRFRRVAVLVSTPSGRLQVQRLSVTDATPLRAFLSEDEANDYLERG